MPILAKDAPALDQQANDLTTQKMKSDAALRELILGHQQNMEATKAKSALDVGAKQKEQQNAIEALKQMDAQGLVNDGGSATVNGVGYGKGYNPAQLKRQQDSDQRHEMTELDKAPASKALVDTQSGLNTVKYMHDLLDNPNKMDQGTFAALKAQSALGGSGSRAIGQVMRALGTDDTALSGDFEGFKNKIMGTANTTRTPEQINAARDSAFKFQDEMENRYKQSAAQLAQQAPRYAPGLASTGQLSAELQARTAPHEATLSELKQRRSAYDQQVKAGGGSSTLQGGTNFKQPGGMVDKLRSLILGGGQAQPAPAAAPQGGQAPMSFDDFKAARKAGKL